MGKFRKAVFVVAYRKEKNRIVYLLLKRKLHWKGWEFPKGGIKQETLGEAVKREIKEETCQEPARILKFKEHGKFKYPKILKDRPNVIGQTWKLFAAEIKNKKIKLDKLEHSDCRWLPFQKAIKLLTWKNQKRCLKIVNKSLKN